MSKETQRIQNFMSNLNDEQLREVLQFILDRKPIESGLTQYLKFRETFNRDFYGELNAELKLKLNEP